MKTFATLALGATAALGAPALAADTLPAGTLITGQVSGASAVLLGLDHLFVNEPGTNTTALAAADLEFITADGAVGVDFFADGRVQVWNNTGAAALAGVYTFSFSFAGLAQPLAAVTPLDIAQLSGGSYSLAINGPGSFAVTLNNLSFSGEFGSFTVQLASVVPEPGSAALLALGLGLVALRRARRGA